MITEEARAIAEAMAPHFGIDPDEALHVPGCCWARSTKWSTSCSGAARVRHHLLVDRVRCLDAPGPGRAEALGHMTITTTQAGKPSGSYRELCGHRVFTIDAPSIGTEAHEPLLILHGFPTSSFDYAAVLDPLRDGRRVLLLDGVGYGLSAKPDMHYTLALQADVVAAFVDELGLTRLALLTHDVGDTVGGELLARRAEGAWAVEVVRRVSPTAASTSGRPI